MASEKNLPELQNLSKFLEEAGWAQVHAFPAAKAITEHIDQLYFVLDFLLEHSDRKDYLKQLEKFFRRQKVKESHVIYAAAAAATFPRIIKAIYESRKTKPTSETT